MIDRNNAKIGVRDLPRTYQHARLPANMVRGRCLMAQFIALTIIVIADYFAKKYGCNAQEIVRVSYGYFREARPFHVACARGWFDLYDTQSDVSYEVTCHPQSSGNVAASRLDNLDLDMAHLGSTPLAQAFARGVDVSVVYISQYQGDSQGIYVRSNEEDLGYKGIVTPSDLRGKTIGVPFFSTVHYQILLLLDLFGLKGQVELKNLSPTEIMTAWDGRGIDGAGCWGTARDHLLSGDGDVPPAKTLVDGSTLANWGRPTFADFVVTRSFASEHPYFVSHVVGVLSRLNDSFLDQLGVLDERNIRRWSSSFETTRWPYAAFGTSFVPGMVDALMLPEEIPRFPSDQAIQEQRMALDLYVQQRSEEQLSCAYLGPRVSGCRTPTLQHIATRETALFLFEQKILSGLGPLEVMGDNGLSCTSIATLCGSDMFNGGYLATSHRICAGDCLPVGKYAEYNGFVSNLQADGTDLLLHAFEEFDNDATVGETPPTTPLEIGRISGGDSTCGVSNAMNNEKYINMIDGERAVNGQFGDGANGKSGKTYSSGLECNWVIRSTRCITNERCQGLVEINFLVLRVWSGDHILVYTDRFNQCSNPGEGTLLAKLSGVHSDASDIPTIKAQGCISLVFVTDGNEERSYGDVDSLGNGFVLNYNRNAEGCRSQGCNSGECDFVTGLCVCNGLGWGADCSKTDTCLGTSTMILSEGARTLTNSWDLEESSFEEFVDRSVLSPVVAYPNDLDCRFNVQIPSSHHLRIRMQYDVELTHDLIWLRTGTDMGSAKTRAVLTGKDSFAEFFISPDEDGWVSILMTTDSRGRRLGFRATVSPVLLDQSEECTGGFGENCEAQFCLASNKLQPSGIRPWDNVSFNHQMGRVLSQESNEVRAMPWAPEGGCEWTLSDSFLADVVAVRMIFHTPLDLEPHPASSVTDKLLVQPPAAEATEFFVESCDSDEACSFPWQNGTCSPGGFCFVNEVVEVNVSTVDGTVIKLITDRNDNGMKYRGLDFDVVQVESCPAPGKHCEELSGGECREGFCYCEDMNNIGLVPCSCTCDGEPVVIRSSGVSIGLVVGILIPLFIFLLLGFCVYRKRKIRKSREQKKIILKKDAELDKLMNSIVGMKVAIHNLLPIVERSTRESMIKGKRNSIIDIDERERPLEQVQWCWKETESMMYTHNKEDIVGDKSECWVKYDATSNAKLEAEYQKTGGTGGCSPRQGYYVDFGSMIQTKGSTGFQRNVKRVGGASLHGLRVPPSASTRNVDLAEVELGSPPPEDIANEPQMVLVKGDVIQISTQRDDGWAYGTKLQQEDEAYARALLAAAIEKSDLAGDTTHIETDTGWFPLQSTKQPSGSELSVIQSAVGQNAGGLEAPDHWVPVSDPTLVERFTLPKQGSEYNEITQKFLLSVQSFPRDIKVHRVERIQNLAMYQSYQVKLQTFCYRENSQNKQGGNELARRRAMERMERYPLWHATNKDVISKILQQGFNRSFCGKNATRFGKGVYFARDASYSAHPLYAVPDEKGFQYMLACRVAVGEYCVGRTDALTPDPRDIQNNILYDSTVGLLPKDTMASPSVYVTYHDAQAYPEYLIVFTAK